MAAKRNGFTRRGFVRGATLTGLAAGVGACSTGGETVVAGPLDRDDLMALAAALLPDEVDARERETVVDDLLAWLRDYHADAEMDHGYGFTRLRFTPPSPEPEWAADLESLRQAARQRHASELRDLDTDQVREIVAAALGDAGSERPDLPARTGADHVGLAVLASYYDSPGAADRAYGVNIRREICRGVFTDVEEIPPYVGFTPEAGR